jgi:hypothetical protein
VTSAIVTCTPVGIAPAWFWGDHSVSWDKAWFRKNKSGELALTFHVSRDGAAPKNEVWEHYEDSPVNEAKKTTSKVHVVLGEDVTYTLDATRATASAPYTGTLTTSEEDTFQVSCQ